MPIQSWDGYLASAKQSMSFFKSAPRTSIASAWFSLFDLAGNPGAGTLTGANATNGVVPTNASTTGHPAINAFGAAATGYLTQIDFGNTVACRMKLFDMVFKAGSYAFIGQTNALTAQPSYSTRVPGGTDFTDCQIWVEVSTAFASGTAWQVQVTYTNQAGVTGRTGAISGVFLSGALTLGRMFQLGLQAGDTGVRVIESVIVTNNATAMTLGAFNILVMRPLWSGRCRAPNDGDVHDVTKTGMPILFSSSALVLIVSADGTSTGVPELEFVIANA